MSIELTEARNQLNNIDKLVQNPELILTNLFFNGETNDKILYKLITINNKSILSYLIDYLKTLDIFEGCIFKLFGYELTILIPSLKYGEHKEFQPDDRLIKISISDKTYKVCKTSIEHYNEVINKTYELETNELSDFWKSLENFNFKNRLRLLRKSLTSNKKLLIKLSDFSILFISKNTVNKALEVEKNKLNRKNDSNLKHYNKLITSQNSYKKYAPEQIKIIKEKQQLIANYLISCGYNEDIELDE